MKEQIEVMLLDGSVKIFPNNMRQVRTRIKSDIDEYVKKVHGSNKAYDIAWVNEEEAFAVDIMRNEIISPIIYVTPIWR